MIEPIGKSDTESAITVIFVNRDGAVVGSCWVYCETERLKDPEFVRFVLLDSLKRRGPSRYSDPCATYWPGLLSDGEACLCLHSEQREHKLVDHDGRQWTMKAGGHPRVEASDGGTDQ